ncbi:hypothetical protein [Sigmofec virus UA08Rod_4258]|uniref:Uncharacterized protein n=1 Tax=Sigmofec virus UA08Rod_4258 TaxID=2929397 RepID=A0A976R7H7_9VIRU|nr:hypothetical protein [Sigmofec virus UA08Rod_4258]
MNPRYCRYTSTQFRSLGYPDPEHFIGSRELVDPFPEVSATEREMFAYGKFKSIIKVLFAESRHPEFDALVTENSSPEVRNFVNNFLFKQIQCLPACSTDEDAFNSIIPRDVQTEAELRPYLDNLKQYISDYRASKQQSVEPPKPE